MLLLLYLDPVQEDSNNTYTLTEVSHALHNFKYVNEIDKTNNKNTKWQDYIDIETPQIDDQSTFMDNI